MGLVLGMQTLSHYTCTDVAIQFHAVLGVTYKAKIDCIFILVVDLVG